MADELRPEDVYSVNMVEGETAPFSGYFKIERKLFSESEVERENADRYILNNPALAEFADYVNSNMGGLTTIRPSNTDHGRNIAGFREVCAKTLRNYADAVVSRGLSPTDGLKAAAEAMGRFQGEEAAAQRISELLIIKEDAERNAFDLEIGVAAQNLSEAQQRVLVDVRRALTVVSVVLDRMDEKYAKVKNPGPFGQLARTFVPFIPRQYTDPKKKRDYYVRKLALIGQAAGQQSTAAWAQISLASFRDDFVALEADTVKNTYVQKLGIRASLIGSLFAIAWILSIKFLPQSDIVANMASFFIAAIGACAGTWLSFAIRRVVLDFNDLALLEDDRMQPTSRILFVVGLTWIVGLFLQTGFAEVQLNDARVSFESGAGVAVLIGMMCGIAERALSGAVAKRSEDFVARLGTYVAPPAEQQNGGR